MSNETVPLITILCFVLLLLVLYRIRIRWIRNRKFYSDGDKIPGPKAYPIIGSALHLITKKSILQTLCDSSAIYGSVFRLWMGNELFVILSDPVDIQTILSSRDQNIMDKPPYYNFIELILGNLSLVLRKADAAHKLHRKRIAPSFNLKMLANSIGMMTRHAELLANLLENELDRPNFNIESYLNNCTFDIICEFAMGVNMKSQLQKGHNRFLDSFESATEAIVHRIFNPWLHNEFIFKICSEGRSCYKNLSIIETEAKKIIVKRKKMMEQNDKSQILKEQQEQEEKKGILPQISLDFLLTSGTFSDTQIEADVRTLAYAGYHGVTPAIKFCLYALSQHKNIQNKLFEDIKLVFQKKEGKLDYTDYMDMKYLDCVVKESLRLYPPVPIIARNVNADFQLSNTGYKIPAGSTVLMNTYKMHRNEHFFPDPEKFLPERFQNLENSKAHLALKSFSDGPRNCLGKDYVMLEMKIILSNLLLKYEFLPVTKSEPPILEMKLVLTSLNGLPLRITRRPAM